MADKFKNKYRSQTTRLPGYDYGSNGAYFITICTKNREHFFGEILDSKLIKTPLGQWAEKLWADIPKQFPFVELGEYVVMPNHVHGILIIDNPDRDAINRVSTGINRVSTGINRAPTTNNIDGGGITGQNNPMLHNNIPRIIRWYKGRCTFENRKIHADFEWQSRYHDHIIRNDGSFHRISNYIRNNPSKLDDDRFR